MKTRLQALLVVALTAAVSVSANAAQFRFHDYSESPDVAWLTVNGTTVTGDGSFGGVVISGFTVDQAYRGTGERITFDYWSAIDTAPAFFYTMLLGAPDDFVNGQQQVSDEFYLSTSPKGEYRVDFISYDSPTGVMRELYPGLQLGASFNELPQWQLVGATHDASGARVDTFEVMSVPEPETYAMMLAGLGLLGAAARRRKQKEAA